MGALATTAQNNELAPMTTMRDVNALIGSKRAQIESVMSGATTPERLYSLLQSAVTHEPKLLQCTPESIIACCMKCAALGLEPSNVDGLGKAYILPYGNKNYQTGQLEATFILGYKGMLDLARRTGEIKTLNATPVFEDDGIKLFMDEAGQPYIKAGEVNLNANHEPSKLQFVFLNAEFTNGGHYRTYMTRAEIDAVRARSKAGDKGPWKSDYVAMARKTVVRRAFPYLPVSTEAQSAAVSDETTPHYDFLNRNTKPVNTTTPVETIKEQA